MYFPDVLTGLATAKFTMAVERDSIIPMFSLRILLACFKS